MAAKVAVMPENGRDQPGRYFIADKESDKPANPLEGDLCYCKETKRFYIASPTWEKLK